MDDFERLHKFLKKRQKVHNEPVVGGDMFGIKWSTLESGTERQKRFIKIIEDVNPQQKSDFKVFATSSLVFPLTSRKIYDVVLEPLFNYQKNFTPTLHTPIVFTFTTDRDEICLRKNPRYEI